MSNLMIEVKNISKIYKLGTIGRGTLVADLQSWYAKKMGREDPNAPLFSENRIVGDNILALNDISFSATKGERIGIIGGNGSGKSTLLKILSRVTTPTSGTAILRGRVTSMLEVGTGFNPEMTGRENIYMSGAILGMTKKEIDNKIDQIISFSECADFIDTPVKRYSSGMYVKLAFSVVAHLDSEIIIADEVLAVGDAKFQEKCLGKMKDSSFKNGKTVLYVSHNMSTIKQLCSRVLVLEKGKIIFDGDVDKGIEIYNDSSVDYANIFEFPKNYSTDIKRIEVSSIEVKNKIQNIDNPDVIELEIKFSSYINKDDVIIRGVINNGLGSPVGMYVSNSFSINNKKDYQISLKINISNLSVGRYNMETIIGIYSGMTAENYFYSKCINFEIVENSKQKNIVWNQIYCGNITIETKDFKIKNF